MASSAGNEDALIKKIPATWVQALRPFLQRANEFQEKDPVVSYFLRTHVAFVAVKMRTKAKEENDFLNDLLNGLSEDKQKLGDQLIGVDGRTTLTKAALSLFSRADEAERAGQRSLIIVRLFYTAALLFEATAQFTDNGTLDSIANERSRYAKFTATKMKKALEEESQPSVVPPPQVAPHSTSLPTSSGSPGKASFVPPYTPPTSSPVGSTIPEQGKPKKNVSSPAEASLATHSTNVTNKATNKQSLTDSQYNSLFQAQKYAKQAVSALQFMEPIQAKEELRKALNILEQFHP